MVLFVAVRKPAGINDGFCGGVRTDGFVQQNHKQSQSLPGRQFNQIVPHSERKMPLKNGIFLFMRIKRIICTKN